MPCYHPLLGYRSKSVNQNGKRSIVFDKRQGFTDLSVELPCGRCIGCRLERSRQWAARCMHEASLHEDNSFITLTYDDDNLPINGSLNKKHFQDFMKRLRARIDKPVRYYHCGEYGEKLKRPHYHACLFGWEPPDKKLWKIKPNKVYTSELLTELWGLGFTIVGNVTYESAAYVARYITKKIFGDLALDHYEYTIPTTGEVIAITPEYSTMSRRPGIGKDWYLKYQEGIWNTDSIIVNAKEAKVPNYYKNILNIDNPNLHAIIVSGRKQRAKNDPNNTIARRLVRERVQKARFQQLIRGYEK